MSPTSRVKRWPGWLLMAVVLTGLLAVGVRRAAEPRTRDERQQAIYDRLACPVCDGESVAESRAAAAVQIRDVVDELVTSGGLTDDEIVAQIDASYPEELELVPSTSGIDLVVWVLPAMAVVAALGGLVVAFGRWRGSSPATGPTDEDRELVAAALASMERAPGGDEAAE